MLISPCWFNIKKYLNIILVSMQITCITTKLIWNNNTNRWMVFTQSLLPNSQSIMQQVCSLFVFILVPKQELKNKHQWYTTTFYWAQECKGFQLQIYRHTAQKEALWSTISMPTFKCSSILIIWSNTWRQFKSLPKCFLNVWLMFIMFSGSMFQISTTPKWTILFQIPTKHLNP